MKVVAGSVKIYSVRLGSSVRRTEYILTKPYKVCLGTHFWSNRTEIINRTVFWQRASGLGFSRLLFLYIDIFTKNVFNVFLFYLFIFFIWTISIFLFLLFFYSLGDLLYYFYISLFFSLPFIYVYIFIFSPKLGKCCFWNMNVCYIINT